MKLYEISARYEQILSRIDTLDPVEDKEELVLMESQLSALDDTSEDKTVYIASNIKNMEDEISQIDEAIERMKKRKESLQSKVKWKSNYLKFHMEKMNLNIVRKSPYFVVQLKEGREIVEIIDEKKVPEEYLRSKIQITVDKLKCLREIKEGVIIPGICTKKEVRLEIK